MEYIIIVLILLVFILALIIVRRNATIKILRDLDQSNFKTKVELRNQLKIEKNNYQYVVDDMEEMEKQYKAYFALLLTSPVKVYTQSNFYNAHSLFNGRYYAKINNKEKNNKAEGIPVIEHPNNKHSVINVYDLRYALKTNPNASIGDLLKDSTILKEVLIGELNNKVLKTYKR